MNERRRESQRTARVRHAVRTSSLKVRDRLRTAFSSRGPGFRHLAESHAAAVAGDTLVALALAGTLFFSVPSTEARENVALYLLLTLAPFAVLGPVLGGVYERFPGAYRRGLGLSAGIRTIVALAMIVFVDNVILFPLAFLLLVLSRFHGISRSSVLPVVLERVDELLTGNAHLARLGVVGSVIALPVGGLAVWLDTPWLALVAAAASYAWSAIAAVRLPAVDRVAIAAEAGPSLRTSLPPGVRFARLATAGVRFLNGYLLLLVAFEFREVDAGFLDFGALLGAAGVGFLLAAFVTPLLDRKVSEEPMVVMALAVEAAAAFLAAQYFGLAAAAALAAAAGFAWGMAKFGFDGLLQSTLGVGERGRAFTNSETMFQIAWVIGALLPVVPFVPIELGLTAAGIVALGVQVLYVTATLIPVAAQRRREAIARAVSARQEDAAPETPDVLDLF